MTLVIIHIAVAFASLAQATYVLVKPSGPALKTACGLVVATLASGAWLVVQSDASILSACLSGLFYLAAAAGLLVMAGRRLARAAARIH